MNKNNDQKNNKKKYSLFGSLFGNRNELSILEEEQVESPLKTMVNSYRSNKVSMAALSIFLLIFLIVLIGPLVMPIDLSFIETTQQNIAPGLDMMDFPKELDGNVEQIAIGPTFSVGLDKDGKVYTWGKTKITNTIDIKNVPEDMGKVVRIAVGTDHVLALNDEGKLFTWGSNRQQQGTIPFMLQTARNIKDIYAGYQSSAVLTDDGMVYFFGNVMNNDYNEFHKYQGQIAELAITADAVVGLTFDGDVVYLGSQQNSYAKIPENMGNVTKIAATSATVAAVNDVGDLFIWGNITRAKGEGNVPEIDSKIISVQGGRYHYTALTEDGKAYAWGADYYNQASVPGKVNSNTIDRIYSGYNQNYAITEEGNIETWGLKGYLLGSDDLGRDIFARLLNGGRMSMTIGAVAVVIATVIGVIVGGISGFFGGKVDMVLQRISEIVGSLPFLPFVMILSSLIGNSLTSMQRVYLIMVILGLLSWTGLQRLVRAQVLSVREQEYVIAAKALGIKQGNIVFKHILPNVISVIIVHATLNFATSMLTEATLSFLGFGVQPPIPTWGNMLFGANDSIVIQNYWWRWVYVAIVLGVCIISVNLIGDGLRDAIDPKSQER
ncbi:MAG: ABC transporter permease subunit [Tissierellaceae bacterium]|nr:ABC transporter permease subunit [Tissierellaceae bacterium]